MKTYTLMALLSVIITLILDNLSGIKLLKRRIFYLFLFIIFLFKLLVNGYLTSKYIVIYNNNFYLGLRLGSIPLEDFIFGFSMVTMTIIFWEYFKDKGPR